MAEKRKQTLDLEHTPRHPHARWLAGFLESGASMRLTIVRNHQNGHYTPQARPEISYGDADNDRVTQLIGILDTTASLRNTKSTHYAVVRGDKAVSMAYSIRPDAPSRLSIINAFLEWLRADFTEDRINIAERVIGRRSVDPVHPHDYHNLTSDAEFVGGVIDCRGRISPSEQPDRHKNSYWIAHEFKVNSVNGSLLRALQKVHGGHVVQYGTTGDTVPIRGTNVTLRNNIFEWILGADQTKRLLSWAHPKLPISNSK